MLKQIKQTNEKILKQHFEQAFGEGSEVEVNWGFPIIGFELTINQPGTKTIIRLNFNSDTEDYQISALGSKIVDEKEVPDFATVSKEIIDFIMKESSAITEQFFTTRGYDPDKPAKKEEADSHGEMAAEQQEAVVDPEVDESEEVEKN
jgi:hypothetical protein